MAEYDPDEFFNRKPPNNADRVIKEQWYGALFKRTNADRIRSLSDEELATYLSCLFTAQYHIGADPHVWLDWLKEDAKEK